MGECMNEGRNGPDGLGCFVFVVLATIIILIVIKCNM